MDQLPLRGGYSDFEPWFCRGLQELGANPVGIDERDLSKEEFEHYELDLTKPGALNIFPDKSFDGINLRAFFDSPRLTDWHSEQEIEELKKEIGVQIKRLLKDDGKILNILDVSRDDIKDELGL